MNSPRFTEHDAALVDDIVIQQPELDNYYRPDGAERTEIGALIAGIFGKVWNIDIQQYPEAGKWRDYEKSAREVIADPEQEKVTELVYSLFNNTDEKREVARQTKEMERLINDIRSRK